MTERTSDEMRQVWNDRYRSAPLLWGDDPNRFVAEFTADLPTGRTLDLGCGTGRNALWLARRGHRVLGVDLSDVAVEHAREAASRLGVDAEFVAADLGTWEPPPDAFDLVLLAYLQVPPPLRRHIHDTAARATAPGGRVVIVAHHLDNLEHGVGGPSSPEVLFTEDELAEDFAGWDIERNQRVERSVDKDGVVGTAIDVVFVARKPA